MTLPEATQSANRILDALAPLCAQIEISGEVRRRCMDVKRLDIVAQPNPAHMAALRSVVNTRWGKPKEGPFPSTVTRLHGNIDTRIYWATPQNFGIVLFVTTGDKTFVQLAAGHFKTSVGGLLDIESPGLYMPDPGGVMRAVMCRSEIEVFNALDCPFVPPENRLRDPVKKR